MPERHLHSHYEDLAHLVQRRQQAARLPSVVATAAIGDEVVFSVHVSDDAEIENEQSENLQYRIGSITKTFTAALVLSLAEQGVLGLHDRVGEHVEGTPFGEVTIAQLLSHSGGLQREAATPMWQTFEGPTEEELLASLSSAELIAPPGRRWHYSNLGYAVLGLIVRRATGDSCEDLIQKLFVGPLGLNRTSWMAAPPAATGYRVDPYQDVLHLEPDMDQRAAGMGGQMWSTAGDLMQWSGVLMGRHPGVLSQAIVDEMHTMRAMVDLEDWRRGWGLGLSLIRTDQGIRSGHTGAVPGFAAALTMDRAMDRTVVVLANCMDAGTLDGLALEISDSIAPEESKEEVWSPTEPCPPEVKPLLGSWWFEAGEVVFSWHSGALEAELPRQAGSRSVFAEDGQDRFRVVEGREFGEVLIVHRTEQGATDWLEWATYPYSRQPR